MSRREFIDNHLNKWISRKLVVFIIASIGLFSNVITSGDWVIISAVYLGSQTVTDIIERLLKAKAGDMGFSDVNIFNKKGANDSSGTSY